jgi:hypothetical protein
VTDKSKRPLKKRHASFHQHQPTNRVNKFLAARLRWLRWDVTHAFAFRLAITGDFYYRPLMRRRPASQLSYIFVVVYLLFLSSPVL